MKQRQGTMKELAGRCAIVTGASRGIGAHIALALAGQGMSLVLAARSTDELALRLREIERTHAGVRAIAVATDLALEPDLHRLLDAAEAEFGTADVLVNNAGVETFARYDLVERSEIEAAIRVNLLAPLLLTHLVLPGMLRRRRGHVVNIASLASKLGLACMETYAATKSGLLGFTQSLRATYAGSGISASAICPGFVAEGGMYTRFRESYQHRQNGSANGSANGTVTAPPSFQPVPATAVGRAVVRAITRDLPEVIVSHRPIRPLLAAATLSPGLAERVAERLGLHRLVREVARGGHNAF